MTSKVVPLRGRGRPSYSETDRTAVERFEGVFREIKVSKKDSQPLWRQIAEPIEHAIRSGVLEPHARIPSEEGLALKFGVSRTVIRHALQSLSGQGLIVKIHRKGIFVSSPPLETDFITSNLSVYDDMAARGYKVNSNTFEFFRTAPDEREQEALQLSSDDTVVRIGRVFWMDDQPITYTQISLNGALVPGLELLDIEDRSILGLLRERYGLRLKRAERWFKAAIPNDKVCQSMEVSPGTPMIWIESVAYIPDNTPLEYYRAYYNSDTASIHLSINS
ncbi:MAG: GntR family transcriptional regulator [Rhizobiaceae bacterium]|nr:GntR family transcriptional regulator [Rhizobiaceae bacterium]